MKFLYHIVIFLLIAPLNIHPYEQNHSTAKQNNTYQQLCMCEFCKEIQNDGCTQTYKIISNQHTHVHDATTQRKIKKNKRTVMIYMAADNDLRIFAARNIQQMAAVGSSENISILVHLDIRISGNKKITRRYLIEKDKVLHVDPYDVFTQQMDSGNPATLISFCEWGIKNYPASEEEYDLILWNHGTGALEPMNGKIMNPMDLFIFNPATHLLELDRSIEFIEAISKNNNGQRGVCWDDTTGNYLTNKKLDAALQTIREKYLNNKKFGIIGFDACLMSMIEVCSFIAKHASVMTGSQEVELGMGWKYDEVFAPFAYKAIDTHTFARHIVESYEKTYQPITYDYTLSAINLTAIKKIEKNVDEIAVLLMEGISSQKNVYSRIIAESRNKNSCTHFDEPSYIDLHHLFSNLLAAIQKTDIGGSKQDKNIKKILIAKLTEGMSLIDDAIIANTTGRNLTGAHGLSIYFPERSIHSSYKDAFFLETNHWGTLLTRYLFS